MLTTTTTSSSSSSRLNKHRPLVSVLGGSPGTGVAVASVAATATGRGHSSCRRRRRQQQPSPLPATQSLVTRLLRRHTNGGLLMAAAVLLTALPAHSLTLLPFQQQQQQQQQPPATSLRRAQNQNNQQAWTSAMKQPPLAPLTLHIQSQSAGGPLLPSSSSSTQLAIDLNDSSIKTRFGIFNSSALDGGPAPGRLYRARSPHDLPDFEELIERLLRPISAAAQKSYTLRMPPPPFGLAQQAPSGPLTVAADANNKTTMRFFRNSKTFASIVYTNEQLVPPRSPPAAASKPHRKLINCHLVDLEKHSSDVQVFEAKYGIKTMDVEFREMMQLIEACTEIARLRSLAAGQPSQGNGSKLFAAALPKLSPGGPGNGLGQHQQQQQQQLLARQQQLFLNNYIKRHSQPPVGQAAGAVAVAKKTGGAVAGPPAKTNKSGKRLVLGEVTPQPGQVEARGGGIKDALQEISSYDSTDLLSIWRGIMPGTNWCGMGDRATSYNDLGFEADIDICCRAHDFCPIRLSAFSAGYGLFNWSFYTRSHCWCDQNFLDCLQRAQSPLSSVVMKFYFTIMKTTCLYDNETFAAADPSPYSLAVARQKLTPLSIAWWPSGGSGERSKASSGEKQPSLAKTSEQEHKLLLEQIKAHMPIPALKSSEAFYSKLDPKPATSHPRRPWPASKPVAQSTKQLEAGYK